MHSRVCQRCPHNAADRGERRGHGQDLGHAAGQSGTVNSASRGRGLTGKPVTESNLSLRVPARDPADMAGYLAEVAALSTAPVTSVLRVPNTRPGQLGAAASNQVRTR